MHIYIHIYSIFNIVFLRSPLSLQALGLYLARTRGYGLWRGVCQEETLYFSRVKMRLSTVCFQVLEFQHCVFKMSI